ncbi:hypothetical protein CABS03_00933 [Colletotrichum abscissum]|uniref:Methyltransferase domain-containing protein n=1 Tax=Colletotrichum abscissum TaxID=1671311 RepID=A0A9Q0B839_9PEZI|nr:hypothetical protein CABS02_03094 [Colletotrichum abscissum]
MPSPRRSPASSSPAQPQSPQDHTENEAVLAAEEAADDATSDYGGTASSTTSVSASILDYRKENGRTYHRYKDGKYSYPNDERENDRLVLDVGTGTGLWAIEFGDEHPEAEVLGIDLSAAQPEFVPPNVKFEIDDIEEPWTFSRPFDYIHSRLMTSSLADWKKYLQNCYDNLAPGGYLELNEMDLIPTSDDGTLTDDLAFTKSLRLLGEAMGKLGRPYQDIPELKDMMVEIGFCDVVLERYKWPTNSWPRHHKYKELGVWQNENLTAGMEGFIMAPFTRIHGWSREAVLVFLVDVRKDINDRNIHAYFSVYSVWGRKPAVNEGG